MSSRNNRYTSSRRNGVAFGLLASAVALVLVAAGVAYSTGHWSSEATHVGNYGAGLHIPPPSAASNQPPATNVHKP